MTERYRLLIMRHAKSSWKSGVSSDHERPLNKRGRRAAPRVAREITRCGWTPEVAISSDSARTRETWERMRDEVPDLPEAEWLSRLYLAGLEELREVIPSRAADHRCVLALGHNYGWEEAASALSGQSITLPTAAVALLEIEADSWEEALGRLGRWRLERLVLPRDLE